MVECVGCGYCCKKVICWEGIHANRELVEKQGNNRGPCPELVFQDGRYWCRLVLEADEKERKRLKMSIHIGAGCCSNMNSDRQNMLASVA